MSKSKGPAGRWIMLLIAAAVLAAIAWWLSTGV
jgi:hypothetical protein